MGTEWNFFSSFGSLNEELQEWEQSHYIEVFCPLYSSFNWQNVWLEFQNNFSCSVPIYRGRGTGEAGEASASPDIRG